MTSAHEREPAVASAAGDRSRELILHVGMSKTGTSSIQFLLRDNRERLGDAGILFPVAPGPARHSRLGLSVRSDSELAASIEWTRLAPIEPELFRREFRRELRAEVDSSPLRRVIFTDEALFQLPAPDLQRLTDTLRGIAETRRVVVYLRRQDDHLVSRYQQEVKVGEVLRLRVWAEADMSDLYDYHRRLRTIQELLAPDELVVRRYERDSFVDGSIYQDFLDAAGIDLRADTLELGPDRNTGLDAQSVEFLRLLNTYRVEFEGAIPGLIDNRDVVAQLSEHTQGPVLTLPDDRLDRFMAQWEESNELTAREFLGDPTGTLFRVPRRTAGTTTEQRLDPSRLDHFFAMVDLPGRVRADVCRIAEREARKS